MHWRRGAGAAGGQARQATSPAAARWSLLGAGAGWRLAFCTPDRAPWELIVGMAAPQV